VVSAWQVGMWRGGRRGGCRQAFASAQSAKVAVPAAWAAALSSGEHGLRTRTPYQRIFHPALARDLAFGHGGFNSAGLVLCGSSNSTPRRAKGLSTKNLANLILGVTFFFGLAKSCTLFSFHSAQTLRPVPVVAAIRRTIGRSRSNGLPRRLLGDSCPHAQNSPTSFDVALASRARRLPLHSLTSQSLRPVVRGAARAPRCSQIEGPRAPELKIQPDTETRFRRWRT
jgi:hypothetical protein